MSGLRYRIEDLVAWVNREAARQGLAGETIPDDPYGSIGLSRFRRSLAWHIARRPNGLVALTIQYGHMRTAIGYDWTTEGYGSRSRGGIHDLIDLETARATADIVHHSRHPRLSVRRAARAVDLLVAQVRCLADPYLVLLERLPHQRRGQVSVPLLRGPRQGGSRCPRHLGRAHARSAGTGGTRTPG
jgi:hypothetical protein